MANNIIMDWVKKLVSKIKQLLGIKPKPKSITKKIDSYRQPIQPMIGPIKQPVVTNTPVVENNNIKADFFYSNSPVFKDMDYLIHLMWKKRNLTMQNNFELESSSIYNKSTEEKVRLMLRHAGEIGTGLSIPIFVPRIIYQDTGNNTGGLFEVDEDGYVTISIKSEFKYKNSAIDAVLAHELCHYILNSAGIKRQDTLENEKITDVCMFVLGFGRIFLAGYKEEIFRQNYRYNHKLGYLTDAEYFSLKHEIEKRRNDFFNLDVRDLIENDVQDLKKQLKKYHKNEDHLNDNINFYSRKYPKLNQIQILEKLKEDFMR